MTVTIKDISAPTIPHYVRSDQRAGKVWPSATVREHWPWWTDHFARPTRNTWPSTDQMLVDAQREWDDSKRKLEYYKEGAVERRNAQEAKQQALDAERAADLARQDAERRQQIADRLRRRYLAAGGTADGFEAAKDDLIERHIQEQTLAGTGDVSPASPLTRRQIVNI